MSYLSIVGASRAFLSATDGRGALLMLECYFDDSGTHNGSNVVVWGGIVGDVESFVELDRRWKEALASPAEGKPGISDFHLYNCIHGTKQFDGYSQGARDRARNRFRTAILETGVAVVACGVDINEWDRQVTGNLKYLVGSAEKYAFGQCVKTAMEVAGRENEQMNAYFDAGRENFVYDVIPAARELYKEAESLTFITFAPASSTTGIQAADTIAYESYAYLRDILKDPFACPHPHLSDLVSKSESTSIMLLGSAEISSLVEKMQPLVDNYSLNSFET